jgi:hypothetical protein
MTTERQRDLGSRILERLLARAPEIARGRPGDAPAVSGDPVAQVVHVLRDGEPHSTRELIDPLPEPADRRRALEALRRLQRRGAVAKVGFGLWQARADLAAAA